MTDDEIRALLYRIEAPREALSPSESMRAHEQACRALPDLAREVLRLRASLAIALRTGGCRGCAEDSASPDVTAKHTCDASERHAQNFSDLIDAVTATEAQRDAAITRAEKAERDLAYERKEHNQARDDLRQARTELSELYDRLNGYA